MRSKIETFLKKLKSQKGISDVLVALLLVLVGVGLTAGIASWMNAKSSTIQSAANTAIENAISAATGN